MHDHHDPRHRARAALDATAGVPGRRPATARLAAPPSAHAAVVQRLDSHDIVGNVMSTSGDTRTGALDARSERRTYERLAQLEGHDAATAGREYEAMLPEERTAALHDAVERFQHSDQGSALIGEIRDDNAVERSDGTPFYERPEAGARSAYSAPRAGYTEGAALLNDATMQALAAAWPQPFLGRLVTEAQARELLRRLVVGRGLPFDDAGINVVGMRAFQGGEIHDNGEPEGRVFTEHNRYDDTMYLVSPDGRVQPTRATVDPGGESHLEFQVAADQQWDYTGNARGDSAKYDRPIYSPADPLDVRRGRYWEAHPEEVEAASPHGGGGRLVRHGGRTEFDRDADGDARMVSAVHSGGRGDGPRGHGHGEETGGDSTGCSVVEGAWFPHFNESLRRAAGGDGVRFTYSLIDPRTYTQTQLRQILDSVVPLAPAPRPETSEPPGEARRMVPYEVIPPETRETTVHPDGGIDASLEPAAVQRAALAGVASDGGELPHRDAIQASFGAHDLGGVRAHVGGAAAEASRAIGARAYATGEDIAFSQAPDLRQAAHEAAHVVQQRAGVTVDGGVGRAGDRYEQHADAVADAVVRGQSVQALLDPFGHGRGAGGAAIQRTPEDAVRRFEQLVEANAHPTLTMLTTLVEPMPPEDRSAVIAAIESRLGAELAGRVRAATAGRLAPIAVAPSEITHADDDPGRLADLELRDVFALYAMRGHSGGEHPSGFHRVPNGAVFSYAWVRGPAGTAILRGEVRSRLLRGATPGAPGVTSAQRDAYRAALDGLDGAPDRLAELRAMVDEAAERSANGETATAPSLVDTGRQGRTYSARGASRLDGEDMTGRIHAAMDVPGPEGTGVYAPVAGTVVSSGMSRGYGNLITLVHDDLPAPYVGRRFETAYAHLSQRLVEGGSVAAGQAIGLMGNTHTDEHGHGGRVAAGMGVHLHFGVIELFGGAAAHAWSSAGEEAYAARRDHIRPDDWLAALHSHISEAPYDATAGAHRDDAPSHGERVQRSASGDAPADNADVVATAQAGVSGGGGVLPHLDAIQASFGGHDVSGIRAHVGGAAAQAARSIGARAYATGDAVAFGQAPDLHEAAHEAAHVVQQRAGVDVDGGVGRTGDRYEQHADAVADAVVRGESAHALLDPFGHSGRTASAAIQRTPEEALHQFEQLLIETRQHPTLEMLRSLVSPMPPADRAAVLDAIDHRLGERVGEQVRTAIAGRVAPFADVAPEITHADDDAARLTDVELRDVFALYAMRGHPAPATSPADGDATSPPASAGRATGFHRTPNGATFSFAWVTSGAGTAALRSLIRTRLRAMPADQLPDLVADLDQLDGAPARISELRALISATTAPATDGEDVAARLPPGVTQDQVAEAVAFDTGLHLRIDWVRRMQTRLRADGRMTSLDGALDTATVTGLMWFQHDAGLTVDGRVTGDTRRAIEAGFSDLHDGLLGDHLEARVLVPGDAPTPERYNYYRDIVTGAGGVFLAGPREINMLGIRGVEVTGEPGHLQIAQSNSAAQFAEARAEAGDPLPGIAAPEGTTPDRSHFSGRTRRDHGFDDVIITLWFEQDEAGARVYHVTEHRGSVDPQSHWSESRPSEGTSHLRDGTYRYELGTHTTDYDHHRTAVAGFAGDPTMEYHDHSHDLVDPEDTTSYAALVPTDGLEVLRDDPHHDDHFLTSDEEARSERHIDDLGEFDHHHPGDERDPRYTAGSIAIHIHSAPAGAPASQGCQNVPVNAGYQDMIHEIAGSANRDSVYYTLIDASRIPGELVTEQSTEIAAPDAAH